MLFRAPLRIDDSHPRPGGEGQLQVVEELEGVLDLVIHVRQDRDVDRVGWQSRVIRVSEYDGHPFDAVPSQPRLELLQVVGLDVLGVNRRAGAEPAGQSHRVVAAPRPDVRHPDPRSDAESIHDALGFSVAVA